MHSRLFFKVYVNYAVMVMLFAIILGFTFLRLYQTVTENNYHNKLMYQARKISRRLSEYVVNDNYEGSLDFVENLKSGGFEEIWTVSNPSAKKPMSKELESVELSNVNLSEEYLSVIQGAFANKEMGITSFSDIHACTIITVGVPIKNANGEACGALLMNAMMKEQDEIINSSKKIIITSTGFALVISFVIAIIFARQLSGPISKMRTTARALADGKYESKTKITRKDELGDLARTIDFLTDKLLENDIERKNLEQMRIDFFANVSHELRTPITVIRAYTETLVDGVVTEKQKVLQYYDRMLTECKSMERLVGDLLLLSKMQNPDFIVETEVINLIQVFDDIVRSINAIAEEKNISIAISKDREQYLMLADYDRIRQMFLIILDNAVKFSPEGATIYITIFQSDKISVSIRDEGIGISKEELPNIFDKFYKSKLRQNAKGSGLGLAIAKQIVYKHNGMIEVKSEIGVGTEFLFYFKIFSEN